MVIDMSETELEVSGVTIRLQIESTEKCDLRDRFAMAALTSIFHTVQHVSESTPDFVAELSYKFADAMLAAREKKDD
jgi:hypothetical protein